jgi:ubiquitin carboxyl-terminal hydrolase 7
MKGKSFEKVRFAVVRRSTYSKPTYLNEGKFYIESSTFRGSNEMTEDILWDVATLDDDLLGLDHVDRARPVRSAADLFLK